MMNSLLGIGRPPGQMDPKAFLLQKFNATAQGRVSTWLFCILSPAFDGIGYSFGVLKF